MDGQSYLGVYLGKNKAAVVCLRPHGKGHDIVGCFSITIEKADEQASKFLVDKIVQGCIERNLKFSEVFAALDCSMFMQHKVHSEFSDIKQISSTVRFDTEEAIATDISDIAIAFNVASGDTGGSDLTVFTAKKALLSDFITALQSNGLDPVSIEPDVNCLSRFLEKNVRKQEDSKQFFAVLSNSRGYFVIFSDSDKNVVMRTLLLSSSQQRQQLLSREVPMTMVLARSSEAVSCLKVFDSTNSVNIQHFSGELGINVEAIDIPKAIGTTEQGLADCDDLAGFAIAYGAALAHIENPQTISFRNDFMPYLGAKKRMERALRFVSITVSLLLVAVGLYVTPEWVKAKNDYKLIRERVENQYASIVPNGTMASGEKLKKKVEGVLRSVKNRNKDTAGSGETIQDRLTLVLSAFNKCAKETSLEVDSIKLSKKVVTVVGTASNNKRLLQLKEELEKVGFEVSPNFEDEAGHTKFTVTMNIK